MLGKRHRNCVQNLKDMGIFKQRYTKENQNEQRTPNI